MSVVFTTSRMGNSVRYNKKNIMLAKIMFKILLNGEATMKVSETIADIAEARYILAEDKKSMLNLIFFTAINKR